MSSTAPLEVGRQLTVTIDNLAFGGDGVGRHEQFPLFVSDVCPGERVQVEVTQVQARFARARLLDVEQPSPARVPALCPLNGQCGGCQLQHLDYPAQVAAKTRMVADAVRRLGHLDEALVADTVPSPVPYGYRNKIELVCGRGDGGNVTLCYHGRDPQQLLPVDDCPLALPEVNRLLEETALRLSQTGWSVYDEQTAEGLLREVGIRYSTTTREAGLLLTTGRREVPEKVRWAEAYRQEVPQMTGLRHLARTRASQNDRGREVGELIGRAPRHKVCGLSLRVSPDVFFQVNEFLLEPMITAVREALQPRAQDHLVDVYGGIGTFGLTLAAQVGAVTLLEIDSNAIHDANANARFNQLDQVTVVHGQAEQKLAHALRDRSADLVILDPPRRGCSKGVIQVVAGAGPRRVVYVSCDPATLARDLQRFAAAGYATERVQPFDLFPQTTHVECLATLAPKR